MQKRQEIKVDGRVLSVSNLDKVLYPAAGFTKGQVIDCEDLFFYVEHRLIEACGIDIAGKMHTVRSRNDMAITQYRMRLRRGLLDIHDGVAGLRRTLLTIASRHTATLMPAHTHTQPAQPTTLAHYLTACVEVLGHDAHRLEAAFGTVNRNPLGACAITTTGFPIDRAETARLLGFEGLQLNSYRAIAAIDYVTESAAAIVVAMINIGKIVQDLLLWSTQEFGFLRMSDAFVQTSSIMPQKRNPVALEHVRILASRALGEAQAVITCAHNTPFGNANDSEDDLQPLLHTTLNDTSRALRLFAGIMTTAEFDCARMRERTAASFLTVTELADTLVREEGLSFREAHQLVAETVKNSGANEGPEHLIEVLLRRRPNRIGPAKLRHALDPAHFVQIRSIPGGPAPHTAAEQIATAEREQSGMDQWRHTKFALLGEYPRLLRTGVAGLIR